MQEFGGIYCGGKWEKKSEKQLVKRSSEVGD